MCQANTFLLHSVKVLWKRLTHSSNTSISLFSDTIVLSTSHLNNLTVAPYPKRFKIFINPKAGKGKAEAIFKKDVLPLLQAAGCTVVEEDPQGTIVGISHVVTTKAAGDAKAHVDTMMLEHYDAALCVGGDGIVHEVINGLANREDGSVALKRLPIGVIPAGTIIENLL